MPQTYFEVLTFASVADFANLPPFSSIILPLKPPFRLGISQPCLMTPEGRSGYFGRWEVAKIQTPAWPSVYSAWIRGMPWHQERNDWNQLQTFQTIKNHSQVAVASDAMLFSTVWLNPTAEGHFRCRSWIQEAWNCQHGQKSYAGNDIAWKDKKARQGQIKKWIILVVNLIMFAVCLQTNPVFAWECSMLFCSNGMKDLNIFFLPKRDFQG